MALKSELLFVACQSGEITMLSNTEAQRKHQYRRQVKTRSGRDGEVEERILII
jgi:hypothetical protein